ncbi:MAG TPA: DUF2892 domain-containing protein [Thermoanaerobaculia bacterium]|nr:DUF2892 domain-containing protein [Thermoanaerobaculia bacterium]
MNRNVGTTERALSLAGGGLALAGFLRRPSWKSAPLALLGAAGAFRGATGFCPANRALGRDSAHRRTTSADAVTDRRLSRPKGQTAPMASDWRDQKDLVQEASEESFPASDAPAFNSGIT